MITLTSRAARQVRAMQENLGAPDRRLRVFVESGGCSGFQYGLMIEESGQSAADQVYESHGVKLFVDPISIRYLKGAEVVMKNKVKAPNRATVDEACENLAIEGLRTLVIS